MKMNDKEQVVDRLLGKKIIKEYHIFSDNMDDYRDDYKSALMVYNELCKDYNNVRLYEQFWDDESEEMIEENCLKAKGGFPM